MCISFPQGQIWPFDEKKDSKPEMPKFDVVQLKMTKKTSLVNLILLR